MRIARFLKTLVSPKAMAEDMLRSQYQAYGSASEAGDSCFDPHVILAHIWLSHEVAAGRISAHDLSATQRAFEKTWKFSVIPWPQNVRALGLQFLHDEQPGLIRKLPDYTLEFNELISPVLQSMESGEFLARYKEANPNVLCEPSRESGTGWLFEPL